MIFQLFSRNVQFKWLPNRRVLLMWLTIIILLAATGSATIIEVGPLQPKQPLSTFIEDLTNFTFTFIQFKQIYGKKYVSKAEQSYRQIIFLKNLQKLNCHNSNPNRTYNMKPNTFLDISTDQFKTSFTNTKASNSYSRNQSYHYLHKGQQKNNNQKIEQSQNKSRVCKYNQSNKQIHPRLLVTQDNIFQNNSITSNTYQYIDWRLFSGPIRYQGICGACYAFTTVDTVAAHMAIQQYDLFVPLSVQQVVDCVNNNLTYGCDGGFLEGPYSYILLQGIVTEDIYPYQQENSKKRQPCRINGGPFKISSFQSLNVGDCVSLLQQVKKGPVTVGINGLSLQFYSSGIFSDCSETPLDHAVIVVGFETGKGWLIKNSWGTQWGLDGFGWIAQGNTCGICNMAVTISIN